MFVYFIAVAVLIVAVVFESAAVDYRFVAAGAVLPLIEVPTGNAYVLHSLAAPLVAFAAVALLARNRRLVQRKWIGLPIGMFMHLVLDRTWANPGVFWWPLAGGLGEATVPELDPLWLSVVLEMIGVVVAVWIWRTADLADPGARRSLIENGRLTLAR